MPLRIRKEVQDKLKASLDPGAPQAVSVPAPTVDPPGPTADTLRPDQTHPAPSAASTNAPEPTGAVAAKVEPAPKRQRKARQPKAATPRGKTRGQSAKVGKGRKPKAATSGKRPAKTARTTHRKPSQAIARIDFTGEIETIRALFDVLVLHASDPGQLLALKSLTEKYLADEPTREKIDRVRFLLQRQAANIRREREQAAAQPIKPVIEATALPATEEPPMPDRIRRGEPVPAAQDQKPAEAKVVEAKPPEAKVTSDKVVPEPKRRKILAWFRRKGGSGDGGGQGGGGGPVDPSVQRHPIRQRVKTVLMSCVWAGIGLSTLTYAGSLVYVNYMRLEIDTAMISGNVEPVNAPFDGAVSSLLVKAGDRLSEGMRFMMLEDPEIEKQVKMASVKVERAREDLRLKQAELESEKLKRDEYVSISKNKMEKIESDIEALEKQEKVARERFDRLSDLFKKGIVIRPRVEEASDKLAEITTLVTKAHVNRKERRLQFESVLAGHFYDGNQVVGRLKEAEAAVVRASAEVDLSLEELQAFQQRRQVNKITAAHDSRVLKVLRQEGAAVKRGDTMLFVERLDDRVVHAFMRQEEVTRISIGDEAVVYVPALRAKAVARVTNVERNAAFLDDVDARYSWKTARDGGPKPTDKDRTARVTLKFDGEDKTVVENKFEIGMPTIVSFQRRSTNTVFSSFSDIGRKL
jgi:multidrug resistance efflux pump